MNNSISYKRTGLSQWMTSLTCTIVVACSVSRSTGETITHVVTSPIQAVDISADGQNVCAITQLEPSVIVYNSNTRVERRFKLNATPTAVRFMPDGERILVGVHWNPHSELQVIELASGNVLTKVPGLSGMIRSIDISADSARIVLGGDGSVGYRSGECAVLDAKQWDKLTRLSDRKRPVRTVRFSGGGRQILLWEHGLLEWNLADNSVTERYESSTASNFNDSADQERLAVFGFMTLEVVDMKTGVQHRLPSVLPHEPKRQPALASLSAVCFIPKTPLLAVAYNYEDMAIWDLKTFERLRYVKIRDAAHLMSLAVSADGTTLAIGGQCKEGGFVQIQKVEELIGK